MKITTCIKTNRPRCYLIIAAAIFFLALKAPVVFSEEAKADNGKDIKKADEIHVTADRLVSDRDAQYAEFTGNVVVTRSGSVLKSDRVKIIYSDKKEEEKTKRGAIDTIIAKGNVVITFEDKVAVSDQAIYNAGDDTIVLTGNNPRVTSGNSYISGEKITLNRTSGKIFVDSGESKRVTAEFHPNEKDLEKPKTQDQNAK